MFRAPAPVSSVILASVAWGTSYAVVSLVESSSPLLITGGRFAVFGALAAVFLAVSGGARDIPWRVAMLHAAGGSVGLYLAEVTAIRLAGAGPTIAVVGSIPLVYALVGARRDRSPLRPLLPSMVLIGVSHVVIHGSAFRAGDRSWPAVVLGVFVALLGVAAFCAYALHATEHLRRRPDLSPERWSSAIGVACGLWSIPLLTIGLVGGGSGSVSLLPAVLFLGLVPSWLATALWNRGVVSVPRALAGQLLVFEPLSAFVFVHLVAFELPSTTMLIGEVLLLAGALLAVRRSEAVVETDPVPAEPQVAVSNRAISSSSQALGVA